MHEGVMQFNKTISWGW